MSDALADTVDELARPIVDEAGLDLLDVEVRGTGGSRVKILVTVDRKGGVDVGTCQQVSKQLARSLEEAQPQVERYTLEVSSPGTSRPLQDQRDFDRVEGRAVKIQIKVPDDADGADEVIGTVLRAEADVVVLEADDGDHVQVAYADIAKAVQVVRW